MIFSMLVKWKFTFLFLVFLSISTSSGGHIRHFEEEDDVQNDSELYFNGKEDSEDAKLDVREEDLPQNGDIFEGDIIMSNNIRHAVIGEKRKKSAIILAEEGEVEHWPKGQIPYVLDDSLKPIFKRRIPIAMAELRKFTCINFVHKTDNDKDYVRFTDGKGCSSSVGRQGGEQLVHYGSGCTRKGTILHEMLHVIGIIHEQSRPDRDEYVKVHFENIKKDLQRNFLKYDYYVADNLDMEYNYNSIMHYSNFAFSKNDQPTLVSKFDEDLRFGQRKEMTSIDVAMVNKLYGCRKKVKNKKMLHSDMTARMVLERRRDSLWKWF